MDKNRAQEIVIKYIQPCLNRDMQITDEAVWNIVCDFDTEEPFIEAMDKVQAWFNERNVARMEPEEQKPYVGALVNLLSLLAAGDITALVSDWILCDLHL